MALRLCACIIAAVLALAAAPLQARALNIVAIGASNTTGFGVGEQNAYPAVLERLLRQKGIDAHVTNAGVNGDVTSGMRNRLDAAVPKGTDIVILQPGGNDLRFLGNKQAPPISLRWCSAYTRAASASLSMIRIRCRPIFINGTAFTLTPPRTAKSRPRWRRKLLPRQSRRRRKLRRRRQNCRQRPRPQAPRRHPPSLSC